jgi:hypothetical protein
MFIQYAKVWAGFESWQKQTFLFATRLQYNPMAHLTSSPVKQQGINQLEHEPDSSYLFDSQVTNAQTSFKMRAKREWAVTW